MTTLKLKSKKKSVTKKTRKTRKTQKDVSRAGVNQDWVLQQLHSGKGKISVTSLSKKNSGMAQACIVIDKESYTVHTHISNLSKKKGAHIVVS